MLFLSCFTFRLMWKNLRYLLLIHRVSMAPCERKPQNHFAWVCGSAESHIASTSTPADLRGRQAVVGCLGPHDCPPANLSPASSLPPPLELVVADRWGTTECDPQLFECGAAPPERGMVGFPTAGHDSLSLHKTGPDLVTVLRCCLKINHLSEYGPQPFFCLTISNIHIFCTQQWPHGLHYHSLFWYLLSSEVIVRENEMCVAVKSQNWHLNNYSWLIMAARYKVS